VTNCERQKPTVTPWEDRIGESFSKIRQNCFDGLFTLTILKPRILRQKSCAHGTNVNLKRGT